MTFRTDGDPPRWAEYLLRCVLRPQDRDVISGDLLEEQCEIQQTLGRRRANRRYIAQVLSIAIVEARRRVATTYVLVGGWIILFFGLLRIPQPPPTPLAQATPLDPQLFLLMTTLLLGLIVAAIFLVTGWLWFVIFARRRRPLRRLQ